MVTTNIQGDPDTPFLQIDPGLATATQLWLKGSGRGWDGRQLGGPLLLGLEPWVKG